MNNIKNIRIIGCKDLKIETKTCYDLNPILNVKCDTFVHPVNNCCDMVFFTGIGRNDLICQKISGNKNWISRMSTSLHASEVIFGDMKIIKKEYNFVFISEHFHTLESKTICGSIQGF